MNILIINGSARKKGFCNYIANSLKSILESFNSSNNNINVEYFNIPDSNMVLVDGICDKMHIKCNSNRIAFFYNIIKIYLLRRIVCR